MPDFAPLSISAPIATLSLNRPDARNALSIDPLSARADELAQRSGPDR